MGAEEFHWGTVSDIQDMTTMTTHATKLNHKNGDKTLHEDLLSNGQEKIGKSIWHIWKIKIFHTLKNESR